MIQVDTYKWGSGRFDRFNPNLSSDRVLVVFGGSGPKYHPDLEKNYQNTLNIQRTKQGKEPQDLEIAMAHSLTLTQEGLLVIAAGSVKYWYYASNKNAEIRSAASLTSDEPLATIEINVSKDLWRKVPNEYAPHQFGVASAVKIRGNLDGDRLLVMTKKNVATPWPDTMALQSLAGHSRFLTDLGQNGIWNPFISARNQISDESGIQIDEILDLKLAGIHSDPETAKTTYSNGIFTAHSAILYEELLERKNDNENRLVAVHFDLGHLRELTFHSFFACQPYMTGLLIEAIISHWGSYEVGGLLEELTAKVANYQRANEDERNKIIGADYDWTTKYIQRYQIRQRD